MKPFRGSDVFNRGFAVATALAWVAGAATVAGTPAWAQSDRDAANVMRAVANDWRGAISEGRWLVTHCADNTFALERFDKGTAVGVDAQHSTSVMSPYVGTIELTGSLETNSESPRANGPKLDVKPLSPPQIVCFRTLEEARAATSPTDISPRGNGESFTMRAIYAISPDGARLTGGDQFYANVLGGPLLLAENAKAWSQVIFRSIPTEASKP
jgi:hypothetical protein